jgi:hypothetical protein
MTTLAARAWVGLAPPLAKDRQCWTAPTRSAGIAAGLSRRCDLQGVPVMQQGPLDRSFQRHGARLATERRHDRSGAGGTVVERK